MKKPKVMGITGGTAELLRQCSPKDFSDDRYEGIALYSRADNKPVVLSVSNDADPIRWRVLDGACGFYFRSFTEATDFCKLHGYIFVKGGQSNGQTH